MDSTLMAGIYGLAGSIIGGLASYFGSKNAAKDNINAQNKVLNDQKGKDKQLNLERIKISAKVIYYDLLTAIYEVFRFRKEATYNTENIPKYINISPNYNQCIEVLSSKLELEQILLLNKLYGLIEQLRYAILRFSFETKNYFDCERQGEAIGIELFSGKNIFQDYFSTFDVNNFNIDILIGNMNTPCRQLFEKLKEIEEN